MHCSPQTIRATSPSLFAAGCVQAYMTDATTLARQAWKLHREHPSPALQDLFTLRPPVNPRLTGGHGCAHGAGVLYISACTPLGSEQRKITREWTRGPGM